MVARNRSSAASARRAEAPVAKTRRTRPAAEEAPTRRTRAAAPAPERAAGRDLSQYKDYDPTAYHKAFATWLVKEVGVRISGFESTKQAFLQGVALATATRPVFNDSEWLEEWREANGVVKRGRKPAAKAEPEPVEDDEDFDDEDDVDEDDEDFDDDESDDDDDSDDEDFDDDEPEEAPATARRGRPAKTAAAPVKAAGRRPAPAKAAPAKAAARRAPAKAKADEDFVF